MKRLVEDPATSAWMRWRYTLHCYASLTDHALARGEWGEARAHAERCLAGAVQTRSQKYVAKARRLLGEIAFAHRQWTEADGTLREALVAEAIHQPTQIWKTHVARARLAQARGDQDAALRAVHAAGQILDGLKNTVRHPELGVALRANVRLPDDVT